MADEPDWDAAEKVAAQIPIIMRRPIPEPSPPPSQVPVSLLPPHRVNPEQFQSAVNFVAPPPTATECYFDETLLDALNNPRERMNVLMFEKKVYEFVSSPSGVLDIPPMQNSFHRYSRSAIIQNVNIIIL